MQQINVDFSEKEMALVALMSPPKTPEEVINLVLRNWLDANIDRVSKTLQTKEQLVDAILAKHAEEVNAVAEVNATTDVVK